MNTLSNCNEVLKQGIFDEVIINVNRSLSENLYEWLSSIDYGQFKRMQDSGLSIGFPIEGVPIEISGNHSVDDFKNWRIAVDQGRTRQFSDNESMQIIERAASETIINGWIRCLKLQDNPGLKTSIEYNDQNDIITFTARWIPNDKLDHPPTITSFVVEGATCEDICFTQGEEIPLGGRTILLKRSGNDGGKIILNTSKGNAIEDIPIKKTKIELPPFIIKVFEKTSENKTSYPSIEVDVPKGYKIIGGGARINWNLPGNHLIESYPESTQKWIASGRDSEVAAPSSIIAWAITIEDLKDEWDVQIFNETSDIKPHPVISKKIDEGYTLTGGGAKTHKGATSAGNFLTASYPRDNSTWEAKSKDHNVPSPASLTVYAIGIKPRNGADFPNSYIASQKSNIIEAHPSFEISLSSEYILTGGGAFLNETPGGTGSLLTASYPLPDKTNTWKGEGKDHFVPSPSTITVYAIGIKLPKRETEDYLLKNKGIGNQSINIENFQE